MNRRRNPVGYASITREQALKYLGLDPSATREQAKKSWRALAAKHHPDRGGDAATFVKMSEAYQIMMGELVPLGETRVGPSTASAPRARPPEQPAPPAIRIFDSPFRGQVYVSHFGGPALVQSANPRDLGIDILGHLGMLLETAFESGNRYGVEIMVSTLRRPVRTNLATMMYDIFVNNVDVLRVDMGATFEDEMPDWDDE